MALAFRERLAGLIAPRPSLAVVESKAQTGPGAAMIEYGIPMSERTNTAQWLRKAQKISHVGWPAVAERLVSGRASAVPWHLEDAEGETIDDESPAQLQAVRELLAKPMGGDPTKPTEGGMRLHQKALWRLTLRHMGVCNVAFWYLSQTDLLAGTPLETLYINPARMTPATDNRGNLIGWVLDADETYTFERGAIRGIPLSLNEVIPFWLDPPDWGYYGVGLVEMALSKIRLTDRGDTFLIDTLASGGRRGSFIGPKTDRMPDEVFDALVAGLRNVAESPDSVKRNIVSKGPLEVTPQASTPEELQIAEVVAMARDDVFAMWGIPPTQTGIPAPGGLNSGDKEKYNEAVLWQGPIHSRLDAFRETLQFYLLDRFKGLGIDLTLVLDEPSFDDETPKYEIAEKARVIPLMNNERRAITGHDPLPDYDEATGRALGVAIILPNDLVDYGEGPSDQERPIIQLPTEKPETPLLESGKEFVEEAKAALHIRSHLEADVPGFARRVGKFLAEQRSSVLNRLVEKAAHLMRRPGDVESWWSPRRWDLALASVLEEPESQIARKTAEAARRKITGGQRAKADAFVSSAEAFVRKRAGDRITNINQTTRDAVNAAVKDVIAEAVEQGLGPSEAAQLLQERIGDLSVWNEARSELVARTETMFAYNDAALESYRGLDVTHVEALDGDQDEVCAERNGKVFTIDEALDIEDHPNGTLDWAPVLEPLEAKALVAVEPPPAPSAPVEPPPEQRVERQYVINIPPDTITVLPTPVTVEAPIVNVPLQPAPVVNVPAPIVNVEPTPIVFPEAKAVGVQEVRIVGTDGPLDVNDVSPPKVKRVIRDDKGRIEGVVEGRPNS